MRAAILALALGAAFVLPAAAATTHPKSTPTAKALVPHATLPNVPLHAEFTVEVNAKGQVVRVRTAKGTGGRYPFFNAQVYGNVLQMWIRHPDGSAEVGIYRVTYDYDPKTGKVRRGIALVRAGGNWGNDKGAATMMMETADREAHEGMKDQGKSLPPLNAIIDSTPSPHP
ncbi:MAG TPA: hypothetical protein VMF11_02705 [Candidatus Baltobacteraceae bacterium]|nr:hypothetical protein [Candidatus Baltobacteraceae bacterium]